MVRVQELGDAAEPFGFDVHATIFSEDAVELEKHHGVITFVTTPEAEAYRKTLAIEEDLRKQRREDSRQHRPSIAA